MKKTDEKIIRFVEEYQLIKQGDKILVALSGGPDSIFLLHFLLKYKRKYGIEIGAMHVNHMIPRDAVILVQAEQAAHGNQIEGISIDGAGFHGEMLRELEGAADKEDAGDEQGTAAEEGDRGLGVKVYVPPKTEPANDRFPSAAFTFREDGTGVTCPAGQTSRYRQRNTGRHATIFRFTRQTCDACPLQQQCVDKPGTGAFGRSVTKNDYQPEYERARERSKTDEFAAVRREHPAVERKLNELLNHHGGRRARYWGRGRFTFNN